MGDFIEAHADGHAVITEIQLGGEAGGHTDDEIAAVAVLGNGTQDSILENCVVDDEASLY
ncbi:hypothetical protein D3C73_1309820 [compost metagenome]